MTKSRWWVAAQVVWPLIACSGGGGATKDDPANDTNAPVPTGGTRNESGGEARVGRGTVTLLGVNAQIAVGSWAFAGFPMGASDEADSVSCRLGTSTDGRTVLEVAASRAEASAPAAELRLAVPEVGAFQTDVTYAPVGPQPAAVLVAMPLNDRTYEYAFGGDAVPAPPVLSSCSASLTTLSTRWATGQLACRDLVPTHDSADFPDAGQEAPRASATIGFDCPIVTLSAPVPGGQGGTDQGGSSSGGRGGSGTDSGGTVNIGGTSNVSGTGGSAGSENPPPEKSCHGVVSSCYGRTAATCTSVMGCSISGDCTGLASSCYSQLSSSGCYSQEGCYWSSVNKNCQGSAWSCSLFSGSATCVSQSGCSWRNTCEGVATSCVLIDSEVLCELQPGCYWQ